MASRRSKSSNKCPIGLEYGDLDRQGGLESQQ